MKHSHGSDSTSVIVPYMKELNRAGYQLWIMASRPYYCGGWDDKVSLIDPAKGWERLTAQGITVIETDNPEELHRT